MGTEETRYRRAVGRTQFEELLLEPPQAFLPHEYLRQETFEGNAPAGTNVSNYLAGIAIDPPVGGFNNDLLYVGPRDGNTDPAVGAAVLDDTTRAFRSGLWDLNLSLVVPTGVAITEGFELRFMPFELAATGDPRPFRGKGATSELRIAGAGVVHTRDFRLRRFMPEKWKFVVTAGVLTDTDTILIGVDFRCIMPFDMVSVDELPDRQ